MRRDPPQVSVLRRRSRPLASAMTQRVTHPACTGLQGVFTSDDARSFPELTSKIPPLGSMLNFDADDKERPRVTNVKTALH